MPVPSSPGNRSDTAPVIWTLAVTRLLTLIRDITPEFDSRARIELIQLGFEDAVRYFRERSRTERCDIVVSAGSNGAYLKNRLPVPVVLIQPSGFDLMQALSKARRLGSPIGVVSYGEELHEFAQFTTSFGLTIEQRSFLTAEDARSQVAELIAQGCKAIVGTGMVTELAEQAGVAGVMLYSAQTVRSAYEQALDLTRMIGGRLESDPPTLDWPRARRRVAASAPILPLGDSLQMRALRETLALYGPTDRTVLVVGDTGTGKELAARALHQGSPRRDGPFVAINCGALTESLLESELFGYDEGAFTGSRRGGRAGLIESAHRGTLFLDEIGEMPVALQTRLLRVLEEREVVRVGSARTIAVDVRVIAATHVPIEQRVAEQRFRSDLYYRLNVLRLSLPALRERPGDIPLLAAHFLHDILGQKAAFDASAVDLLEAYAWPGNVRELRNLMERLSVFLAATARSAGASPVTLELLLLHCPELLQARGPQRRPAHPEPLRMLQETTSLSRSEAARRLGISRTTLWRRLKDQGADST